MIRRNVPTIALTMPNSSEIQRYAKKPPVMVIPERIQVVMARRRHHEPPDDEPPKHPRKHASDAGEAPHLTRVIR